MLLKLFNLLPLLITTLLTTTLQSTTATPTDPTINNFSKRSASTVLNAVTTISTQLITLNNTVTAYPGGIEGSLTALQIQAETIQLEVDLKTAIIAAKQSANFTDEESLSVAQAFVALEPTIASTLTTLVSRKKDFDDGLLGVASLSFLVEWDLQQLSFLSSQLGKAVLEKLSATYAALAPLVLDQISAAFASAIAAYK
ncbi:cell wall mannoprotein 1 family protein [Aspergillus saccharolyticus JOP 1030-1]|uniref:Antigenic cell wall galactomanno protein n=1 Tax=Aspergillus saccharolyticus JOP 1030-1 TaxID=1450539 RepID=A0A319A4L6_9EURO|nr:antigenic cell wall galactomanno protein [Aspergillus saccharolyticus JOP 1030-1]PYH47088.1 antigenic cell wall galactomanno protein [Aspergillus saccharolyticus JOP 1030-1]